MIWEFMTMKFCSEQLNKTVNLFCQFMYLMIELTEKPGILDFKEHRTLELNFKFKVLKIWEIH